MLSAPFSRTTVSQTDSLQFQHIFVINLPSRTDRRDALTLAAALSELDMTWVSGVAGKDVLDKVLPGGRGPRQGFTAGNKGSWRAHMNVLQRWVQTPPSDPAGCSSDRNPGLSRAT